MLTAARVDAALGFESRACFRRFLEAADGDLAV